MAHYPLDLRRKRILREQNDILTLDQRIEEARRAREVALYAFEEARVVIEDATKELAALCARRDTACNELSELRLSYRRAFMATVPLDVLRQVFDEVAALPPRFTKYFQHDGCYIREYARAPFSLAAVCRRWRAQALDQPSLWTYISVPDNLDDRTSSLHRNRIACLLQRSQSRPLDILIYWYNSSRAIRSDHFPVMETILRPILACALRWRTFELTLPQGSGKPEHLSAIKGPLPSLEFFRYTSVERYYVSEFTSCFPFAPKLRELVIWGPNALSPSPPGLSSLRSLRLWYHLSLGQMLPVLREVSGTLESLAIGIEPERDEPLHPTPFGVTLPKLTSLTLDLPDDAVRTFELLENMRVPALRHLLLPGNTICEALAPFLEQIAPTTHTLTLGECIRARHLQVLVHLAAIHTLVFDDCNPDGGTYFLYGVSDAFFGSLSLDKNPELWPKLERVELSEAGSLKLGAGSGVPACVESRTRAGAGNATTPCRLQAFEMRCEVPEWLSAEVARLLQN